MNPLWIIARGLDVARQHVEFLRSNGGILAADSCYWCSLGLAAEAQAPAGASST